MWGRAWIHNMTWQPQQTQYHTKRSPQLAKRDPEMALCQCPSVGVRYGGGTSRGKGTGPKHWCMGLSLC